MSSPSFFKKLLWRLRGYLSIEDLKKKGLTIGTGCKIMERVVIDASHCSHITIGKNVTIAPQAYILAHDTSTQRALGYTFIGKVVIEDGVFIGAGAIILPNVRIGKNSIIGAGAVVTRGIPAGSIAVGNPAQVVGSSDEFVTKHKARMKTAPLFGEEYTLRHGVTRDMQDKMNRRMKRGYGYIK